MSVEYSERTKDKAQRSGTGKKPNANHGYTAALRIKHSEVAIARVRNLYTTRSIGRNDLDSNGFGLDGAFIPEDVRMVTTGIDKRQPCFLDVWLASRIVPFLI